MADIATLGLKVDSSGVVRATRDIDKLESHGAKAEKRGKSMGIAFGVAFAGIAVAAAKTASAVIRNTIEQERVTAQLEATLRSTGNYTPELSKSLQDYASQLQSVTTYGDEAIVASQALMLTFRQISGEVFPRAQMAVLDVATAMGTDLKSAAIQVGKALNDPTTGMSALSRSGITFTEVQKDLVKSFVETNQLAKAQDVILTELEAQFAGSAKAAKNTLGGAITSLQNSFGDLLEGDKGSTTSVIASINELTDTLNSPSVKQGFQAIVTGVFAVTNSIVNGVNHLIEFDHWLGVVANKYLGIDWGFTERTADSIIRVQDEIATLEEKLDKLSNRRGGGPDNGTGLRNELKAANEELDKLYAKMNTELKPSASPIIDFASGSASSSGGGSKKGKAASLGDIIRIQEIEPLTERNLILERYNALLLDSETVAQQVKTPQQAFTEQIQLLNELRDTINRTTGENLLSQEQYTAAVEQAQSRLESSTKKSTDAMSEFTIQAFRNMETTVSNGFFDVMQGNFDNLGASFKQTLDRMVADMLASDLLNFGKKLLEDNGGISGIVGGLLGGIPAYANGTDFASGGLSLVGERGPELVNMPRGAQVIPNNKLSAQGGQVTVNINVSGVRDEGSLKQTAAQIAQRAGREAQRAQARNG
jgi:hypothetical protein